MARISYVDMATVTDPELVGYMEHSRRHGTPRPETQAIRFHVPGVAKGFSRGWETIFRGGTLEHPLKELCRVYVSKTIDCDYWGSQRSLRGRDEGLTEADYDELLDFESSDRFDARQKAALLYTSNLVWNPEAVDAELIALLREHFTDEQIVELGGFVALTFGQQRVIKTWAVGHNELPAEEGAGLAEEVVWTDPYAVHPGVAETWGYIERNVLESGVVDQELKELCLRYVVEDVDLSAYEGRERAALEWAHAIVWDSAQATDELWERLHAHFTEPELVDLGCAVGYALGLDHFRRTLHAATS